MLFNSIEFIFLFLPISLAGYFYLGRKNHITLSIVWLILCSLFFYAYWNPIYVILLLCSIFFNFWIGKHLFNSPKKRPLLFLGISVNLGLLCYFKYSNFIFDNINNLFGSSYHLNKIILPLAISFFTFQQIAFLVDAYRGRREYQLLHYCLFVTFFPQLIAGPIVHHKEMMPQFSEKQIYTPQVKNIVIGLTIFFLGLFKKVVIADHLSENANLIFDASKNGYTITFFEAWLGSISYTLQLYFDFSGYADMAIGSARLFGIKLPDNFNSPYKANNIIEFWRRWHMTLSRFLRDYIYIPLGGNRRGAVRKQVNIIITMLLGGLWHGANWTFVLWGGLHGVYLVINYLWQKIQNKIYRNELQKPSWWGVLISRTLTLIAVIYAWVFFRAENIDSALNIVRGMSGLNGISFPEKYQSRWDLLAPWLIEQGATFANLDLMDSLTDLLHLFVFMIVACLILPNTKEFIRQMPIIHIGEKFSFSWQYTKAWAFIMSIIVFISIAHLGFVHEFLYFQF